MSLDQNQTPASIHGPILEAEADVLSDFEVSQPKKEEFLKTIGAVAGANSVALVVRSEEGGEPLPSHFVSLDPEDMGTALSPEVGAKVLGLPTPETAHAQLAADRE